MFKLYVMIGDDWHKIRCYVVASMLEAMARVKTCELTLTEPWSWQILEPGD